MFYLALDEVYHPLCVSLPRNATLRKCSVCRRTAEQRRDSHPLWRSLPRDFSLRRPLETLLQTTIHALKARDFHFGLIPVHSPLLRESCLVSFPPLNYMLKFSGLPCLSSGHVEKVINHPKVCTCNYGMFN